VTHWKYTLIWEELISRSSSRRKEPIPGVKYSSRRQKKPNTTVGKRLGCCSGENGAETPERQHQERIPRNKHQSLRVVSPEPRTRRRSLKNSAMGGGTRRIKTNVMQRVGGGGGVGRQEAVVQPRPAQQGRVIERRRTTGWSP